MRSISYRLSIKHETIEGVFVEEVQAYAIILPRHKNRPEFPKRMSTMHSRLHEHDHMLYNRNCYSYTTDNHWKTNQIVKNSKVN